MPRTRLVSVAEASVPEDFNICDIAPGGYGSKCKLQSSQTREPLPANAPDRLPWRTSYAVMRQTPTRVPMKQFHTKGRENSGNCACFPLSWGRRPGSGRAFPPIPFSEEEALTQFRIPHSAFRI